MFYLHHPVTVGKSHDVPLLPEESGVRPLDHLKLTQQLHGIYFTCGFVPYLEKMKQSQPDSQDQLGNIIFSSMKRRTNAFLPTAPLQMHLFQ